MPVNVVVRTLMLAGLALTSGTVHAASTAFQEPDGAPWGAWSRGDGGSVYAHWEGFSFDLPGIDSTPDAGSSGAATALLSAVNPGAFVTGGGAGGNIYSFSDTPDFNVVAEAGAALAGPLTVALQIALEGTDLDDQSVLLNGTPYDQKLVLVEDDFSGAQGDGVDNEYLYLWSGIAGGSAFSLDFNAEGAHLSLDAVALDIGPAPVPLPASAWLLASSLGGIAALARRRRSA